MLLKKKLSQLIVKNSVQARPTFLIFLTQMLCIFWLNLKLFFLYMKFM